MLFTVFSFMPKNKYTRSQSKYIRKEKARIRREFFNLTKQEKEINKVFDKVSGKLHQHPVKKEKPATKEIKKEKPKSVPEKKEPVVEKPKKKEQKK